MSDLQAVFVLTARGIETILAEGGSQAWVLDAKRARGCKYVVCIQNSEFSDDWGRVSAPNRTAFLVGRLKEVVRSTAEKCENRWMLAFSEYAEIDVPNAWPGNRNPVFYGNLEQFGIDIDHLAFQPMPEQEPVADKMKGLTLAEAKSGLAAMFGVEPSNIEISVRC